MVTINAPRVLPGVYGPGEDGELVEIKPPEPCPDLLTEEEAVRYLRLDTTGVKNPGETLERYRGQGKLRGTQVGRRVFYRVVELERFLDLATDQNPR